MVDSLQVAVVVIVIFVVILATEILFSFCRLYHWIKRKVDGDVDPSVVPPGRYRRSSISHNWSEASVERARDVFSGHEDSYDGKNFNATNDLAATNDLNAFKDRDGLFQHHRQMESNRMFLSEADILISDKSYSGERSYATKIESSQVDMSLHRRRRASSAGPPSDRILLASDFIKTVELEWASGQFVCHHCKTSLSGQRYILHEDRSYCRKCYEKLYANICDKCKTPITCDFKDLSCKNRHWHDKCFRCSGCLTFLIEKPFAYKDHQLYCASCYESRFAARCTLCRNIFRAGMKKYEYKGRQWHAECFCCRACQKLIGTSSFIPRGQDVMCVPCYEKQLGQNCFRCHKVISRGGVIYKNSTWHRECFQCSHCHKSLSNEKYTSVDQRPFCVRCYGDLHAKKCDHCKGAITGIDEPTFISFNQHHYHSLCFRCSKCDKALFGKGFMTEQDKIFCPDCCKET